MEYYYYWLCNITGIGNVMIRRLLNVFGDAKAIYDADKTILEASGCIDEKHIKLLLESKEDSSYYQRYIDLKKDNIGFVYYGHEAYPQRLIEIDDYPICLYYKGKMVEDNIPSVAIIGSRNCSDYGRYVARKLGRELGKLGIQVISGLARGIDKYGHIGTLEGEGKTFAVLGSGIDVCYPKENIDIYTSIIESDGGIISEYPPGTRPLAGQFPLRNRIISGLADVVIVVEARDRSGTHITVSQALNQNKDVMAVPGRIGDELSKGCLNLIREGAQMVTCVSDVLFMLGLCSVDDRNNTKQYINEGILDERFSANIMNALESDEKIVYSVISLFPKDINTIIEETGLSLDKVSSILLKMVLNDYVREVSKNNYVRNVL